MGEKGNSLTLCQSGVKPQEKEKTERILEPY